MYAGLTEVFCGNQADFKESSFSLWSRLSLAWTTEGPWSRAFVPLGDLEWAASAEANEEPFTFVWRVRSRQKRLSANKDKQISHLNLNTWLLPSGSCMCPGVESRIHPPLTPGGENIHPQVTSWTALKLFSSWTKKRVLLKRLIVFFKKWLLLVFADLNLERLSEG